MNRSERVVAGVIAVAVGILVVLAVREEPPPDWRDSFSRHDRIAFGAEILYDVLPDVFPGARITPTSRAPWASLPDSAANAIYITTRFEPNAFDTEKLLDFAYAGGRVFVAAYQFAGEFADSLGMRTAFERSGYFGMRLSGMADSVGVSLDAFPEIAPVVLPRGVSGAYFSEHGDGAEVLGTTESGRPNFVRLPFGDGFFLLSATPVAFTNYALVDEAAAPYAFAALSYLPVADVVWDEFFKPIVRPGTPLRYILSERSLTAAYWLLVATILVGMVLGVRRRQRVIPIIEPPRNDTLEFVRTVGALYHRSSNHTDLARKKVAHLMTFIRTDLRVSALDHPSSIDLIAARSGTSREGVERLLEDAGRVQQSHVTNSQLMALSSRIDAFYESAAAAGIARSGPEEPTSLRR